MAKPIYAGHVLFADVVPYHSDMYWFEKDFSVNTNEYYIWIRKRWMLSVWMSVVYVILVFGGKWFMSTREKFELRLPLSIWNLLLTLFSVFGMIRTLPEFWYIFQNYGLKMTLCNPSFLWGPTAFWGYAFVISKAIELGDTAFIILRKQPLIFLHWYHHITVMIYCWYMYGDVVSEPTAPGRWFMVMNYSVHSFMYTYYTLRACRVKLPKWVSVTLTTCQLLQMVTGLVIGVFVYTIKQRGEVCMMPMPSIISSLLMYLSYFFLFAHFYYNTYINPKTKQTNSKVNGTFKGLNSTYAKND